MNPLAVEWNTDKSFQIQERTTDLEGFVQYLKDTSSIVLIASHGEYVEDGYIQKIFEDNQIKFTGSNSKSCKLAMDKVAAQEAVKDIVNIIPTYTDYSKVNFPFIAKPNALGSSVGIFLIEDEKDLNQYKSEFSKDYIFQPFIDGVELSLGTVREGEGYMELYPTEILPTNEFF